MKDDPLPEYAYIIKKPRTWPLYIFESLTHATEMVRSSVGERPRCWKVKLTVECELEYVPPGAPRLEPKPT